jgi:transcriptional regulator with XRE-family HTH domain
MVSDKKRLAVLSSVACILREERIKQDVSLTALAAKAGLSHQMVSFVERERRNPTLDTLLRISDALGVDFAEIMARAQKIASKK